MSTRLAVLLTLLLASLTDRIEAVRRQPDRGSHATEYAIGIGLSAAAVIALYGAFRTGLAGIVKKWVFG